MKLNTFSIEFDYPGIFLVFAIFIIFFLVKLYYTGTLFGINKDKTVNSFKPSWVYLLFTKFIILLLLVLLLFNPTIYFEESEILKNKHLFLIDNSSSILQNDSTSKSKINNFLFDSYRDLSIKQNVEFYIFGDSILSYENYLKRRPAKSGIELDEKFSDLSLIASPIYLFKYRFLNKYYKSITIVSDGNFNRGSGFRSINFHSRVNCISIGKIIKKKDILIEDIIYEKDIILENKNEYEVVVKYDLEELNYSENKDKPKISNIVLDILDAENKIIKSFSKKVALKDGLIIKFKLDLDKADFTINNKNKAKGLTLKKLKFVIENLEGETNLFNNEVVIHQKVVNNKSNIIFFSEQNDFNLHFFKHLLKDNAFNYHQYSFNDLKKNSLSNDIDLAVFLNYPISRVNNIDSKYIRNIKNKLIFITDNVDKQELAKIFNFGLQNKNLKYKKKIGFLEDYKTFETSFLYSKYQADKSKTNLSNLEEISLDEMPPIEYDENLILDNSKFNSALKTKSKYGNIVSLVKRGDSKVAIVNINSIWKLLFSVKGINGQGNIDYSKSFELFLLNLVSYLSNNMDNEYNKITPNKDTFYTGEQISFKGEIFDKNLKSLDNEKVKVIITSLKEENSVPDSVELVKEFYLNYSKKDQLYNVDFIIEDEGFYNYEIVLVEGSNSFKNSRLGNFKVLNNDLERANIGMNLENLRHLTKSSDGDIYSLDSLDYYVKSIMNFSEEETLVERSIPITKNIYYFFIIIFLLTIEWILRKIKGLL